ncbi:MAG: AMP-binding protein, partial [Chakrabartia sp.]
LPHVERIFSADEARDWIGKAERTSFAPTAPDEAVLQLYTSGTTGNPKGAILSNLNLFGLRVAGEEAALPWSIWDDDEVALVAMPCAHIGGTGLGVMALGAGIPGHILAEFSPEGVLDAVEKGGVTRFFMVPAALQMVITHPRATITDFGRLKYIFYGAAPIPLDLLRECIKVFGAEFIQVYGMTETTGTIVSLWPEDHDPNGNTRMRAAGRALPGVELKVVDEDGVEVPTGHVGELMTRSSNNMLGYWKMPEATQKTLSADGWIRTGDACYLDEDGYLFIHDRMKDMIISGGENVYPAEVESAIYGHPAVHEVAVIGIPDDKWGEAVKAICVPKPGMMIDEADVIAWAKERIAGFKVPKSVDVIAALPRNASGKILRKDLRAPHWEGRERMVN